MREKSVLLSFDLEEFDTPLEYGYPMPFNEQIQVSRQGTEIVLSILEKYKINATFFSTIAFSSENNALINLLCQRGHELGSHGCYHSSFEESHLLKSRQDLETLTGRQVRGFRMPRMKPVSHAALSQAGYKYDSSLHPTYIPGRYNNFFQKRWLFQTGNVWELPASATPIFRIPLFWLTFHHFPLWLYKLACLSAFPPHQYIVLYFHPWEFVDLSSKYGLPRLLTRTTGAKMAERFERLMQWMVARKYAFPTFNDFIEKLTGPVNKT